MALPHVGDQGVLLVERKGSGLLTVLELRDLATDLLGAEPFAWRERKLQLPEGDDRLLEGSARRVALVPDLRDAFSETPVLVVESLDLDLRGLAPVVELLLLGRELSHLCDQVVSLAVERAQARVDRPQPHLALALLALLVVGEDRPWRHAS